MLLPASHVHCILLHGPNKISLSVCCLFRCGSFIHRRSTVENCQHRGPSRWHGGNFEHVQNFRRATASWANLSEIAAAPPLPPRHRRASAVQPPCNREKVDWRHVRRSRGVSTAVMAVLPRCYHLTGPAVLPSTPQSCRQ